MNSQPEKSSNQNRTSYEIFQDDQEVIKIIE